MENYKNSSIGCHVKDCKYHCGDCDYCSKSSIEVSACNCNSTHSSDATCCRSFEEKTY